MRLAPLIIIAVALCAAPAHAQQQTSRVVSSCGSASYSAGQSAPQTVDTAGNACVNGSGGGSPTSIIVTPSSAATSATSQATTAALAASLAVKATPGNLYGFYCNAITGGASGYCVAYNATAAPGTGALTGASVLDVCYFNGAAGCSLNRIPMPRNYSTGIVILVTSAATPFTYTTGVDTAYISADFQ